MRRGRGKGSFTNPGYVGESKVLTGDFLRTILRAPQGREPSRREGRKVARDGGGAARVVRDAPPESRGNCSLRSESRQGRWRFLLELFAVGVDPRPMAHSYSARLGTELGKSQLPDTISYLQRQGRVFDRVRPLQVGDQSIVPPGLGSQATAYPGFRRGYARKARAQPRLHPGLLSVPPCGREHNNERVCLPHSSL